MESLAKWTDILVMVSLHHLESTVPLIRNANECGNLKGILLDVPGPEDFSILPNFLHHVRMRNQKNLIVHSGPDVPFRVINAYCIGAEEDLIANATVIGDELFILNCASRVLKVRFADIRVLKDESPESRSNFVIAADGSHIAWTDLDIHLDLESFRCAADPEYGRKYQYQKMHASAEFGSAVARVRKKRGFRQTDFTGLSERQIRRIENGDNTSIEALRRIAVAYDLDVNDYLNIVAETAAKLRSEAK